ncbi:MAG TPA: flagellar hook-associated protein FlgL [Terriglobia bacterium]|nr:flagellar hook-associated protein FlgL [Terriglobia bacterium]
MGLRIAPDLYATVTNAIGGDRQRLNTALQQISTGQSVNSPSDNPAAVAALIENNTQSSANDQFLHSISSIQGSLQTADSTLGSVVNALNQAISIGTEGANGTISDSERQAMAQEMQSIQQTVMGLANTSYQGSYLFAGTAVTSPPYVADPLSASGVTYAGNSTANNAQVGADQFVPLNLPGSAIFNGAGADVFQALHDLSTALASNSNITSALGEVQKAFDGVNTQRTFYGNTLQGLSAINGDLEQEQLTLAQQTSHLISADPAQAASTVIEAEYALNSALSAFGHISQNTLLDYLK